MKMLNKKLLSALLFLILLAPQTMAQTVSDFTAVIDGSSIILSWKSGSEVNLSDYCIQRSFDGRNYYDISVIKPEGNNHNYRYTDQDLYKEAFRTYYYRIELRMKRGPVQYSQTREVTLSFSGIQRTWGSIKAMFR